MGPGPLLVLSLLSPSAVAKQPVAAIRGVEAFHAACIEGDLGPKFDAFDARIRARNEAASRGVTGALSPIRSEVPGMPPHAVANPSYARGERPRCTVVAPIESELDGLSIEGSINDLVGGVESVAFTRVVGEPWALAQQEITVLRSEKMPESLFVVRRVHVTRLRAEKGGPEQRVQGWDHVLLERFVNPGEAQAAEMFLRVQSETAPAARDQTAKALARFNAFAAGKKNDVADPGPSLDRKVYHVPAAMLKTVWALEALPIGSAEVAATAPEVLPEVGVQDSIDTLSAAGERTPKTVKVFAASGLGTAAVGGLLIALPSRPRGAYTDYMDAKFEGDATAERELLLGKVGTARTVDRVGLGLLIVGSAVGTFSVLELLGGSGGAADVEVGPGTIGIGGSF